MKVKEEKIRYIIDKARYAPSGDNCQPWFFEWDEETLFVFHSTKRSEHPLDPKGVASILTLGCLIETIRIAASELNLKTSYTLRPLVLESTDPWAEVRFHGGGVPSDPLAEWIQKRATDRRTYLNGVLPKDFNFHSIVNDAQIFEADIHFTTEFTEELVDYVAASERKLVEHETALPAVLKWIRFKGAKSRDGLLWKALFARTIELPLVYWIQRDPKALRFLRWLLIPQFEKRASAQLRSSAALICVSIPNEGSKFFQTVQAGRLMMRTWLQLTKHGYGVHPLTIASAPILYQHLEALDPFFRANIAHIEKGQATLRKAFAIPENRKPVWMVRTGPMPALPQTHRSPRLTVEEVLKLRTPR